MGGDGTWWAVGAVAALAALGSTAGRGSLGRLRRVPDEMVATPRRAAEGRYVFPRERTFPIGDLFHARLAMIYALSPTHRQRAPAIRAAVRAAFPDYDWTTWWREHTERGSRAKGPYPFALREERYRTYTDAELEFAAKDAAEAMRSGVTPSDQAFYADDVHTIRAQMRRRKGSRG